jgi:hypothetical protein
MTNHILTSGHLIDPNSVYNGNGPNFKMSFIMKKKSAAPKTIYWVLHL